MSVIVLNCIDGRIRLEVPHYTGNVDPVYRQHPLVHELDPAIDDFRGLNWWTRKSVRDVELLLAHKPWLGTRTDDAHMHELTSMSERDLLTFLWTAAHGLDVRRHFDDSHPIVMDLRVRLERVRVELEARGILP